LNLTKIRKNGENRERTRWAKYADFCGFSIEYNAFLVRYAENNLCHSDQRMQSLQNSGGISRKVSDCNAILYR